MTRLLQIPIVLLLLNGFFLGINFPMGKTATQAGTHPTVWAFLISVGAVMALIPILLIQKKFSLPQKNAWGYVILSGLISYILPNILIYSSLQNVGAGYLGLMFALSPVFTLTFSALFKLKKTHTLEKVGILFGLCGASLVTLSQTALPDASLFWIVIALSIPLCLACGNIYRTVKWPAGETPDRLAFWSHAIALITFVLVMNLQSVEWDQTVAVLGNFPVLVIAQLIVAGLTFPVYFRLQSLGGPVLLSQMGYVAAAVGLLSATAFLGETYGIYTWIGAGIIAIGVGFTIAAQLGIKLFSRPSVAPSAST